MPNSYRLHKKTGVRIPPSLHATFRLCARMRAFQLLCVHPTSLSAFVCVHFNPKETLKSDQESEETTKTFLCALVCEHVCKFACFFALRKSKGTIRSPKGAPRRP